MLFSCCLLKSAPSEIQNKGHVLIALRAPLGLLWSVHCRPVCVWVSWCIFTHFLTYSNQSAGCHARRQMPGWLARKPRRKPPLWAVPVWKGLCELSQYVSNTIRDIQSSPWGSRRSNRSPSISNHQGNSYFIIIASFFFFFFIVLQFITTNDLGKPGCEAQNISERNDFTFFSQLNIQLVFTAAFKICPVTRMSWTHTMHQADPGRARECGFFPL